MSSATVARPRPGPRPGRIRIGRFTLNLRDRDTVIYLALAIGALAFPTVADFVTGGAGGSIVLLAADAGVYVLLALGLNVVVGFAGLLDLGYAAFFAIGAYTYALMASGALFHTPLHHAIHIPFWLLLIVGVMIAATAGALLGAPTLRLRGDYLAIVTLGFGEIVPRVFRNAGTWTGGVNAISAIDAPSLPVWLDGPWNNGAAFHILRPFDFTSGSAIPWYILMLGLILVLTMLLRPQGLLPSRQRSQELHHSEHADLATTEGTTP